MNNEKTKLANNIVLGILAHVDAGKTTLSEDILYKCGVIRSAGRVDHGNSYLDTDPMEKERGITIFSKEAQIQLGDKKVTLLDTPGHVDFSAETERALQTLDYAVLVISANAGVQAHTETLWKLTQEYGIPTFIFVNKMDQETADKQQILLELQRSINTECVDFSIPMEQWEQNQKESIAVTDEAVMNSFLENNTIDKQELSRIIKERKIFPCFFGSALKDSGIDYFLENLSAYMRYPEYPSIFGARVYKITRDPQGNRMTHIKITGGCLKVKDVLASANWNKDSKINQIRIYCGNRYELINEAAAGTICTVTGLDQSRPGEGLGYENQQISPFLEPVLMYRIEWKDLDAHTVLNKLKILEEENPELHISWNEGLSEIYAHLMGEVQIEVLKNLIKERFGMDVSFDSGQVVYHETIQDEVYGVGHYEPLRHYAEVHLIMEPLPRGSGLVFESICPVDELSLNWQRLILMHLKEREHKGVLTGSPITDIRFKLAAGRAHNKHTEGGDFRQATYRAVRQGLMQAETVLLEPYYNFRIMVPYQLIGNVLHDIECMSGKFEQPIIEEEMAVVAGKAPVVSMRNYAKQLASFSKGKGRISLALAGYDLCHNRDEVIEEKKYDPEHDLDYSADSVFCEHGAGHIVPWNEVFTHRHVEGKWTKKAEPLNRETTHMTESNRERGPLKYGQEEQELKSIFERTYGAPKDRTPKNLMKTLSTADSIKKESDVLKTYDSSRTVAKNIAREEYLLVDGYNIIFSWEDLNELAQTNVESARGKLMDILCDYQGVKQCRVILVFDAYRVKGNIGEVQQYHNIEIVYTKEAETADQYIEKTAHAIGRDYHVTVATSDGLEQLIVWGQGCHLLSARELKQEIEQTKEKLREEYLQKVPQKTNLMSDVFDRMK